MRSHKTQSGGLVLLAAATLVVAACSSNDKGGMAPPPPVTNDSPTISAITDKTSNQDTVIGPIEFTIGDRESEASQLTVSATADGTTVIPADGLSLGGSGATRSITLTPLEAATGTVNVRLVVTDPQGSVAASTFGVTVTARAASVSGTTLTTFAKGETDEPTEVNGYTFTQDADDPAIFEPLIGAGEE